MKRGFAILAAAVLLSASACAAEATAAPQDETVEMRTGEGGEVVTYIKAKRAVQPPAV